MNDGFDMLPADVRAIVRAEQSRVAVPDEARARLAERLSAAVPGFGSAHVPAMTAAPAAGALTAATVKVLVALALGVGAAAALSAQGLSRPARDHARVPAVIAHELAPHAARVLLEHPDVSPPAPAPSAPIVTAPVTAPLPAIASLREERRLLDEARDAIERGDPELGLAPTASHAARFPHGVLGEERDALRIRALARLGRTEEARALLERMRAAYPRSFLLEGAASEVEAIP
jgi:pentatricopeptide repeat protein